MATSSSDESCTAPKDFHLSSSLDSGSRLSPTQHKCQLCCNFRKKFYCRECVQNGLFASSSPHYSERFAFDHTNNDNTVQWLIWWFFFRFEDKKLRYRQLQLSTRTVEELCWQHLVKKQQIDDVVSSLFSCNKNILIQTADSLSKTLKQQKMMRNDEIIPLMVVIFQNSKIRQSTERIRFLKLLHQEAKEKQTKNNSRLKFLQDEIVASNIRLPKYDERVGRLERYVEERGEKVEKSRNVLAEEKEKLKKIARLRINQLIQYVFPIKPLHPSKRWIETTNYFLIYSYRNSCILFKIKNVTTA